MGALKVCEVALSAVATSVIPKGNRLQKMWWMVSMVEDELSPTYF